LNCYKLIMILKDKYNMESIRKNLINWAAGKTIYTLESNTNYRKW
jgi:hypothetical protein